MAKTMEFFRLRLKKTKQKSFFGSVVKYTVNFCIKAFRMWRTWEMRF